ncbi:MAG: class II histone deacetylase [Gammaproteobacteria bacterium]|nr:class II histone deacetylase [Gammaproteobacteria bacterium]
MKTGFVHHELFMWHNTGNFAGVMPFGNPVQPYEHVENPETKRRIKNLLDVSGMTGKLVPIEPRPATEEELLRFHTKDHIEKIQSLNESFGVDAGFFTPMGRGSYEIALLSAGGVIEAVDAVLSDRVDNAYALVRPPGHHALPDLAMGFCLFGNAVIAGKHALDVKGLERIAYVDWDVHHGNGTQAGFYDDPRALTISVHQDNCFPPDSGHLSEIGEGAGEGFNINVPLPPGSGNGAYEATFDRVVLPALRRYKPELIIVPSGFDAGAHDPLGRMMVTGGEYRSLTRKMMRVADEVCDGRLVLCHEGGYNAPTVPFYALAVIEALSGVDSGVEDPFDPLLSVMGQQELQPHQDALIRQAEELLDRL